MTDQIRAISENNPQPANPSEATKRGQRIIQRTYLISILFLIFAFANDVISFGEFGAWQILGDAGGIFTAIVFLAVSYWQYRRGDSEKAKFLIPFAIFFAYAPGDLFLEGVTVYNLISGLLLHAIAFYIFRPRNQVHWLRLTFIFLVAILLFSNLNFYTKFDIANSPSWETSLPITTIAIGMLLAWQIV